jgi:hypothetical protein
MGFPNVEEPMAQSVAAVGMQQDAFSEIKNGRQVEPGSDKGFADFIGLVGQRDARGSPHHIGSVIHRKQQGPFRTGVNPEVFPLVFKGAFVEVWIIAKYGDAEPAEVVEDGFDFGTAVCVETEGWFGFHGRWLVKLSG